MTEEATAEQADEEAADEADGVEETTPPTIEEQLAAVLERAETAEAEIGYRDANLQNMRRKFTEERAEMIRYAGFNLARRMLSVMGDVDRALDMIPDGTDESVGGGLRLLRSRLWQELESDGVTHISAEGQQFDPTVHEAVSTIPASEEHISGIVVEVIEAGYRYKDRLIRAARVIVAS